MDKDKKSTGELGKTPSGKGRMLKRSLAEVKKSSALKKRKNMIFIISVIAVLTILAVWMLVDKFFTVRKIEIKGSSIRYSSAEIAEKIGVDFGEQLLGLDIKELEMHGKYNLPQFDEIRISISLPDKVVLNVKEAVPSMYCAYGGKGYVLSENLRVISECDSVADAEALGLMLVIIPDVERCVVGEYIKTKSESDELLKKLYSVFKESDVAAEIVSVDITDKFDIVFEYQSRFTVKLGSSQNITVKLRAMKGIIKDLEYDENGVIDVSDEKIREWSFKDYSKM